ncbi:MAG: hypothetical protein Solivirus2_29 [Solivirus sp.]|uniref:Uncharacterized protein n=1 Tax=Solivirus sp. TaxID=2487772 RepID=A0A3G5AFP5_9VIRU|nr:MAG: hypothetical protein Solivirus2_29 [Solivirus sp.]
MSQVPKVGDFLTIQYRDTQFIVQVYNIIDNRLYLRDIASKIETSLTFVKGDWKLPNGDLIPFNNVSLYTPNAISLPVQEPRTQITDSYITELELLKQLDHDSFMNVCLTNKFLASLCNGKQNQRLYESRMEEHYPKIYKMIKRELKETPDWRKLYFTTARFDKAKLKENGLQEKDYPNSLIEAKILLEFNPDVFDLRDNMKNLNYHLLKLKEKRKSDAEDLLIFLFERHVIDQFDEDDYNFAFDFGLVRLIDFLEKREGYRPDIPNILHALPYIEEMKDYITKLIIHDDRSFTVKYKYGEFTHRYENLISEHFYLTTLKYLKTIGVNPTYNDLVLALQFHNYTVANWLIQFIDVRGHELELLEVFVNNFGITNYESFPEHLFKFMFGFNNYVNVPQMNDIIRIFYDKSRKRMKALHIEEFISDMRVKNYYLHLVGLEDFVDLNHPQ